MNKGTAILLTILFGTPIYIVNNLTVKYILCIPLLIIAGFYFFGKKPKYKRLELKLVSYPEADKMLKATWNKPEAERWVLATKEEDTNKMYGMVYLERKIRIK